jgi:hypothetical protein
MLIVLWKGNRKKLRDAKLFCFADDRQVRDKSNLSTKGNSEARPTFFSIKIHHSKKSKRPNELKLVSYWLAFSTSNNPATTQAEEGRRRRSKKKDRWIFDGLIRAISGLE